MSSISNESNMLDLINRTEKININNNTFEIKNVDGLEYLQTIKDNSIDLILTDPPYIISRSSGMNTHYNNVRDIELNNNKLIKTEKEWNEYKLEHSISNDDNKMNYLKYGTIYGKKYCVKTDYGDWDSNFTIDKLEEFITEYYNKLKKGGTVIIFFDLWKLETLKKILEKAKFKQIRFIEWIKNKSTTFE
jgi:site-specific DNA-methyltransferase (adenine-specific)